MRRNKEPAADEIWNQVRDYVKWKRVRAVCVAMAAIKETFPDEDQAIVLDDLKLLKAEFHALIEGRRAI